MLQRSVPISVSTRSCSRAHTFWYVTMVVTIETTTPRGRARKTSFWSTLDTLIFLLFLNLCCSGSWAAVATLKQMLANNCYETHERSVFFDFGLRTIWDESSDEKWLRTAFKKTPTYRYFARKCSWRNMCFQVRAILSRHLIYIHFCVWLGLFVDLWWLKEVWYAPDFFVKL